METVEEKKFNSEFDETIFKAFKEFMARVSEFEELVAVGGRLLSDFRQGLEVLRRPPIDKSSKLLKSVFNVIDTKRVQSYLVTGCKNIHDSVHNISKLHACHLGLLDISSKGRIILNQLESLLDDVTVALRATLGDLPHFSYSIEGEMPSKEEEEFGSSCAEKHEATDFPLLMAAIFRMIKQDLTMQERIISGLNPNSSSGELESYSLMWSLRPFVEDSMMDQAWKLIP